MKDVWWLKYLWTKIRKIRRWCPKTIVSKKKENNDSSYVHGRYLCDFCGVFFRSRQVFHQHRQIHLNVRNHKCDHCSKTFRRRQHLIAHQNTHSQERRFVCDFCGKKYKSASSLSSHITKNHKKHDSIRCWFFLFILVSCYADSNKHTSNDKWNNKVLNILYIKKIHWIFNKYFSTLSGFLISTGGIIPK